MFAHRTIQKLSAAAFFLLIAPFVNSSLSAQVPTGIDPGVGDDAVPMWEDPTYVVIVVLVLAFVILGFWIRRRR